MIRGRLLTLAEAAVIAGVATRTLLRWVEAGDLLPFTTDARGRRLYLDRDIYEARRSRKA